MDKLKKFFDAINEEEVMILATALGDSVTMRVVSPVYFHGNVLMFTDSNSLKYAQLKANPNCSIAAGGFFAEATAQFLGKTMLECNKALRAAYCKKFPNAFDEGIDYGGRESEFISLKLTRLKGWDVDDSNGDDKASPLPFDIKLT